MSLRTQLTFFLFLVHSFSFLCLLIRLFNQILLVINFGVLLQIPKNSFKCKLLWRNVRQTRNQTRLYPPPARNESQLLFIRLVYWKGSTNLLQPTRSTKKIWVVTCHQYKIFAVLPQVSFRGETSGGVGKWHLFSTTLMGYFTCSKATLIPFLTFRSYKKGNHILIPQSYH